MNGDKFLPADIDDLLDKYGDLLQSYPNLPGHKSIFSEFRRTNKRLEVLFPLKKHPVHGITGLLAVENYSEAGFIRKYQYNWKIIIPKMGVLKSHITSWGNDPHSDPDTPAEFIVETEPHHQHYDPDDRRKRTSSYRIRTLE